MLTLTDCKTLKGGVWGICPICGDSQFVHKRYDIEPDNVRCESCSNRSPTKEWRTEIGPAHWLVEHPPDKIACYGDVEICYRNKVIRCVNPTYENLFDWFNEVYNPYEDHNMFFEGIIHIKDNKYQLYTTH